MKKCIDCYHLCCFGNPNDIEEETWCGHPDGNYAEPWNDACDNFIDKNDKNSIEIYEKDNKQ